MKQSNLLSRDSKTNQRFKLFQDYLLKSIPLLLGILFSLMINVQAQDLDPSVNGTNLTKVTFTGNVDGAFEMTSDKEWGEFQGGEKKFSFKEIERDAQSVSLVDPNRGTQIVLDLSIKRIKINGSPYYHITEAFANPSLNTSPTDLTQVNGKNVIEVVFTTGAVEGSFRQISGKDWGEFDYAGNKAFSFEETKREEWMVHLKDKNRPVTIGLDLATKKVIINGSPYYNIIDASANPPNDSNVTNNTTTNTTTNTTNTNNTKPKGAVRLFNKGDYDLKVFIGKDKKEHSEILLQDNQVVLNDIPLGTYISFRSLNANDIIQDDALQAKPMYVWTLKDGYIYNVKAQDGITDRQDMVPMAPNLKGVDISKLDPQNIYGSLSTKPIFESMEGNTSRDYHSADNRFIKDGFDYINNPKGIGNGQSRMMYQSESVKKQWSINVDLTGSVPVKKADVSGGLGVGYKEYDNTYQDQKDIYVEKSQSKAKYAIKCDSSKAYLDAEFKQAIKALPATYSKSAYKKIVDDYGTHFLREVVYGGFYNQFLTMSENAYNQLKGNSLDVKANVGVHFSSKSKTKTPSTNPFEGTKTKYSSSNSGGDLAVGYSQSVDEEFNELSSQMKMGYSYGGGNGDFDNWQLVDDENSVPVIIKPQLLSELISIEVFRDDTDPKKLATIKANMLKYLKDYLSTMPEPKPMPSPPVTYTLEILDVSKVEYVDNGDATHRMDLDMHIYGGPLERLKLANPKVDISKGEMQRKVLGMNNEHPDKLNSSKLNMTPKIGLVIEAGNPEKKVFKISAKFREGNSNFAGQSEEYTWTNYINPDLGDLNKTRTGVFHYYEEEHIWGSKQLIDIKVTYRLTRENDFFIPLGLDVNKPSNAESPELVNHPLVDGKVKTDCNCKPQTFRVQSDHTWAEFRLPQGQPNESINIPGGAHNKYVFPKCNRVWWDNLRFTCDPNACVWKKVKGNWDADGLCHGSPGSNPYLFVGER